MEEHVCSAGGCGNRLDGEAGWVCDECMDRAMNEEAREMALDLD